MSLCKTTQLIVHAIAAGAIKENGVRRISEITWYTNADYRACSNVTYAIERSNTSVLLNLTWDANTRSLSGKIFKPSLTWFKIVTGENIFVSRREFKDVLVCIYLFASCLSFYCLCNLCRYRSSDNF